MTTYSFCFDWFALCGVILGRYFIIAGGAYWLLYCSLEKSLIQWGISLKSPPGKAIQSDIKLSVLSAVIFALGAALIRVGYDLGITRLYSDLQQYGFWYLGSSFVIVLFLQDTYFYFIHRLFHCSWLFKWLHQGHHRSRTPTPWTSFAFDPSEALVQTFFLVGIVFIVPLHFVTLGAVLMTMTFWAVVNHLGFELFPKTFPCNWFSRWFIGPTHHLIHHRKYTVHYGLYFTFWDKLLNTHDPSYQPDANTSLKS